MAANMYATGSFSMGRALAEKNAVTCLHKFVDKEEFKKFYDKPDTEMREIDRRLIDYVWVSVGGQQKDLNWLKHLQKTMPCMPNVCIDVANGYSAEFVEFCAEARELLGNAPIIMAGNVCTPEMVQELIISGGVDIVKVGIGPGSACTTRLKTGVGYPQLSAIAECAHAAHGLKSDEKRLGLICADGGCKNAGDVCKAFAANADFVMLGGMFAGCSECDGDWTTGGGTRYHYVKPESRDLKYNHCSTNEGPNFDFIGIGPHPVSVWNTYDESLKDTWKDEPYKVSLTFYGMSSEEAQNTHSGGVPDYATSEGKSVTVPHKGPAQDVLKDVLGGISSCCTYIGAKNLKEMSKCATFVKVNNTHNRIFE